MFSKKIVKLNNHKKQKLCLLHSFVFVNQIKPIIHQYLGQIINLIIFKIMAHLTGDEKVVNWRMLYPELKSRSPIEITCHNCGARVTTVTQRIMGESQQVWGFLMGVSIVLLPFCWIPCVIPAWNDILHYCPNCNVRIGIYRHTICCGCIY